MNANLLPTGSAYFLTQQTQQPERHTLTVLVDNEPGVLARVVGLFSARGFNIDSLTVSETEHDKHRSRITVVTVATPKIIAQVKLQLERLVPVHRA
jgi:acetolactate synthase-1/3 small subunit